MTYEDIFGDVFLLAPQTMGEARDKAINSLQPRECEAYYREVFSAPFL